MQLVFFEPQVQWTGFTAGVASMLEFAGVNTDFIEALPTALMKPLSGSGARGMMVDAMTTHGADSFVGKVASTVQGATDTTFYILAVYFGAVGIKNTRYAVVCGLNCRFCGNYCRYFYGLFVFSLKVRAFKLFLYEKRASEIADTLTTKC